MTSAERRWVVPMPPPNVTGTLHLGHALTLSVQDALVRSARLDGTDVLYVPGTDHAGLGTYAAVRRDETFRPDLPVAERTRAWADHYRKVIVGQFHALGLDCDWDTELHTLSPAYRELVDGTFVRLAEAGLLHRSARVMPWCPSCRSTVPDVEHSVGTERVPLALLAVRPHGRPLVVELAAAEELWGAVALAVPEGHPAAGGTAVLPVTGRELPVLAAATGAPRPVVPAHRQQDLELAEAHGLPWSPILDADGRSLVVDLPGLSRQELRRATVERFGLRTVTRQCAVERCGVCGSELMARLHHQWYLRLAPLMDPVRTALDNGDLVIRPSSVEREARHWLDSARDWCISRQIRWGQPIPAVVCGDCAYWTLPPAGSGSCLDCGGALRAETDVFDTWFNSAHWPIAVSGWPAATARSRYPAAVMTSGRDILFFWFIRLLAIGTFVTGSPPTRECWLHGLVVDEHGQKMSKSRGNGVTLDDALAEHGRDVLRAALLSACRDAEDIRIRQDIFTQQAVVRRRAADLAELVVRTPESASRPTAADELEHYARHAARSTRAAVRRHLRERHFDRAVEAVTAFGTRVLARYATVRAQTDGAGVTPQLLLDLAAVYEPFMPDTAAGLRKAAATRSAADWLPDEQLAAAVRAVLATVEEAERLRGVAGIPAGVPVTVESTDTAVGRLLATRWFGHLSEVALVPGPPPDGAFAVRVPGAPGLRLWLSAELSARVRDDVRRRLRKLARERRRLAHRLDQVRHGRTSGVPRERLAGRLARAEEATHELRGVMAAVAGRPQPGGRG
ncbi:class I tRNA ligase family protein [Streptomyces sp. NPDC006140]|uniref:class I tRNA ligase family protein n=1 Tax=Streptomyces sp. NPDC006140 TaxID=3154579 RepID=UPI0033E564C8